MTSTHTTAQESTPIVAGVAARSQLLDVVVKHDAAHLDTQMFHK